MAYYRFLISYNGYYIVHGRWSHILSWKTISWSKNRSGPINCCWTVPVSHSPFKRCNRLSLWVSRMLPCSKYSCRGIIFSELIMLSILASNDRKYESDHCVPNAIASEPILCWLFRETATVLFPFLLWLWKYFSFDGINGCSPLNTEYFYNRIGRVGERMWSPGEDFLLRQSLQHFDLSHFSPHRQRKCKQQMMC